MSLQDEIDSARKEIKTDGYPMSIGELVNIYQNDPPELDIHPEFQRFYRWTEAQRSRFIESLLLGIPIPPIFVAQTNKGVWDVIDGVQRLSTILEFFGILKNEDGKLLSPLILHKTKYLPSLEGMKYEDPNDPNHSFSNAQKLFLKRAKLDISIVLRESDEKAQYELFQRLNTGGSRLSEQEVRNCIIVMLDKEFYKWLNKLGENTDFQEAVSVTDRATSERYDQELALRFLIFRTMEPGVFQKITDVGEFITEQMIGVINNKSLNFEVEEKAFNDTFALINRSIGSAAFKRYDLKTNKYVGGFLLSAFETVALGIGYNIEQINYDADHLILCTQRIWADDEFQKYSGSGVRGSSRIPKLITLGRTIFKP